MTALVGAPMVGSFQLAQPRVASTPTTPTLTYQSASFPKRPQLDVPLRQSSLKGLIGSPSRKMGSVTTPRSDGTAPRSGASTPSNARGSSLPSRGKAQPKGRHPDHSGEQVRALRKWIQEGHSKAQLMYLQGALSRGSTPAGATPPLGSPRGVRTPCTQRASSAPGCPMALVRSPQRYQGAAPVSGSESSTPAARGSAQPPASSLGAYAPIPFTPSPRKRGGERKVAGERHTNF